jgi:hypothetical protein
MKVIYLSVKLVVDCVLMMVKLLLPIGKYLTCNYAFGIQISSTVLFVKHGVV